jgi:hypothetical protein
MKVERPNKPESSCICSYRAPIGTATCALCRGAMYPVGSNPFAKRQEAA